MFAWLQHLFRAHELPVDPAEPVRVDLVARVRTPNLMTSPITGMTGALIEVGLLDWLSLTTDGGAAGPGSIERFTRLGSVLYGAELTVADARGTTLFIPGPAIKRFVPLTNRGLPVEKPLPPELASLARISRHVLAYQESLVREDDKVRVVGTVRLGAGIERSGYRDVPTQRLVAAESEPLTLYEML